MFKFIFEYFADSFSLFEDPLNNYIAMTVVGLIAFSIAWNAIGKLYRNNIINSRGIGNFVHWLNRLIVFVVSWCIFTTVVRIINWIMNVPTYVWFCIGGVIENGIGMINIRYYDKIL